MRRGAVRYSRLQQFLVAFAALGMLLGVRPSSIGRGRLDLKLSPLAVGSTVPESVAGIADPVPLADFEESTVANDRDEDGTGENDSESLNDSPELERNLVGRSAPARNRSLFLGGCLPAAMPSAPKICRGILPSPSIPEGLPVRLCRLTC